MRYLWLGIVLVIALIGVLIGRALGLSPELTATLSLIPTFLALYPFIKRWMPRMNFVYWALTAVTSAAVMWLLFLVFHAS